MAAEFEGRILLSANLLDSFEKVEDTVKHEYAHLLAVARHGWRGRGHGAAWRKAMRELGLSPDVHHNYECRRNQTHQVVKYRCVKCGAIIERKRKFPRGKRYEHLNCGGAIHFHSIEPVIQVEPAA